MTWTNRRATAMFQQMVDERHREIGRRIAQARSEHGWSQEDLAYRTGLAVKTISRMENGHNEPRGATARVLADNLGLPIADLLAAGDAYETQLDRMEAVMAEMAATIELLEARIDAAVQIAQSNGQVVSQNREALLTLLDQPNEAPREGKRVGGRAPKR